ncbi:MAG: 3-hydroxybutyryl-CoA dehydrogenase [Nocardioidaceae bacterium]|nr:3-hydroxybutyryl-CoA dehydrogenase [Nocardioidaceae bacterium]
MELSRVGIVGGGVMGAGIVQVFARAGLTVTLVEVDEQACRAALDRITTALVRHDPKERAAAWSGGSAVATVIDEVLGRIRTTEHLEDLHDCELVVEAAPEAPELKIDLFRRLGAVTAAGTTLASNTSSVPIVHLGAASGRPEEVIGLHFFNPVPAMRLVEIIPSVLTAPALVDRMQELVTDVLGKTPVLARDRAGFVVNTLLVPYLLAAVRMFEAGFATAEDIDRAMTLGCGHPMGPLALCDLIGLDTVQAIGKSMYDEFKEPQYAPPPLLDRMVSAGLLGRKSGRGFY